MRRVLRRSLTAKVVGPIVAIAILSVGVAAYAQRRADEAALDAGARARVDTVARSVGVAGKLAGPWGVRQTVIELARRQRAVVQLDAVGGSPAEIVASTTGADVGRPVGDIPGARGEMLRRAARAGDVAHGGHVDLIVHGDGYVDAVRPLDLQDLGTDGRVYGHGVLLARLDADALRSEVEGLDPMHGTQTLLLVALVAVVAAFAFFLLRRFVLGPLAAIERAIKAKRAPGEAVAVPVRAPDGVGRLAASLNRAFDDLAVREAELRASEGRFRALVEHGSDLIVVIDAKGTLSYVSPSVERLLGYDADRHLGADPLSFVLPEDHGLAVERLGSLVSDGDGPRITIPLRLVAADGSVRHVEARGANRLEDPLLPGLIVNMRDVTERERFDAALKASEARNRAILANAADAIISMDGHGNIVSFNAAAERIFAYRAAQIVGRPLALLVPQLATLDALAQPAPGAGHASVHEVVGRRHDGGRVILEAALSAVLVDNKHTYTAILRDVSEQRAFEEKLEHQALHDSLTGLPNRRKLLDRVGDAIARAKRSQQNLAILFLDLDRFKVVNDSLGHESGDRLLMEAATRIRHVIREVDTLARIGGDEFVVLCEEVHSVHDVTDLAERILGVLEDEFDLDGVEAFVSTSIGIARWSGNESPDDLLRNADTAMYRAKESGRARFELFDDAMQAWAAARLDFETSLRHAVGRGELRLHFQPIVELETGEIVDCEALVRWERPNVGLVGPVEFIPVAEETGLIVPIGAWVLEEACREAARWQREWPGRRIGVSVNLSSRQIARSDIVTTVREALAHSGLEPQRLSLEITESLLVEDTTGALDLLHELKALGVRLALDDFGTGYSSLTYLRRFPIDVIKIDQSFVRTIGTAEEDTTIVAAIIDLARALHIDVIAEGVSDLAHVAALLNLGARFAQGYHFARPVPPEVLPTVLLRGRAIHAS